MPLVPFPRRSPLAPRLGALPQISSESGAGWSNRGRSSVKESMCTNGGFFVSQGVQHTMAMVQQCSTVEFWIVVPSEKCEHCCEGESLRTILYTVKIVAWMACQT